MSVDKGSDAARRERLMHAREALGLSQADLAARIGHGVDVLTINAGEKYFTGGVLQTYEELVLDAMGLDHSTGLEVGRAALYAATAPMQASPADADRELRAGLVSCRNSLGMTPERFAGLVGLPAALVKNMECEGSGEALNAYCMACAGGMHTAGMDVATALPQCVRRVAWPEPASALNAPPAAPAALKAPPPAPRAHPLDTAEYYRWQQDYLGIKPESKPSMLARLAAWWRRVTGLPG